MYNGNFLIPANSKRAQLIFSAFRVVDLIILGTGASIALIAYIVCESMDLITNIWIGILVLMPLFITAFLVIPVPNYHNMLCILQNIYRFYFVDKQQYTWKGWCVSDEYKE